MRGRKGVGKEKEMSWKGSGCREQGKVIDV